MDNVEFWSLIERSGERSADRERRERFLIKSLRNASLDDLVDFALHLDQSRRVVDSWRTWGAATVILDGFCSDDSFYYFQLWLVGLGREAFERIAADPDALAELPEVRQLAGRPMRDWDETTEWPEWESLNYVVDEVLERRSDLDDDLDIDELVEARGYQMTSLPDPIGSKFDFDAATLSSRYPQLSALFKTPAART